MNIECDPDDPCLFYLDRLGDGEKVVLKASSPEEAADWVDTLHRIQAGTDKVCCVV